MPTFTKGRRAWLVSICESWGSRATWEAGKHTCELTVRLLDGSYIRLLPAGAPPALNRKDTGVKCKETGVGTNTEPNGAQGKAVCSHTRRSTHTDKDNE